MEKFCKLWKISKKIGGIRVQKMRHFGLFLKQCGLVFIIGWSTTWPDFIFRPWMGGTAKVYHAASTILRFRTKAQWLKITKKVSFKTLRAKRAMFTFSLKMPKMVNFGDFSETWKMRLFWWFSTTVSKVKSCVFISAVNSLSLD